ncbi:hypothetical protein Tcan_03437 [Toxocara canis]|uniref:EB domain-containing protein n=1 Tax=Toxocara canis TaxID=6265 RepID=A0A0B2UM48_TOXCA|nr:hypothetical protein Tcan_03437 [Toxocara canis]
MVENFVEGADDCPSGQVCVAAGDSPVGHCCPVVCPLATHPDTSYSCDLNATAKCPSDTHFCHRLSDGGFSQAICCRRPCNALAPDALFVNGACMARGQLNSQCTTNEQCGGGESMQCNRVVVLFVNYSFLKLFFFFLLKSFGKRVQLKFSYK